MIISDTVILSRGFLRLRKKISKRPREVQICLRIAQLRVEVCGPRGKSRFARLLRISPSTYDRYESGRVPPAPVLVRIAQVAGVDLGWLLTGAGASRARLAAAHPAVQRAAELLENRPAAAGALAAFLDLLTAAASFPQKRAGNAVEPEGSPHEAPQIAASPSPTARGTWIPILGRSAAGVPQFWSSQDEAQGVTTLGELVERYAGHRPRDVAAGRVAEAGVGGEREVQIIALRDADETGAVEFVSAGDMKARYADAFAVRIDGESMSPDIRHGDIVILSPSAPAADARPAIVQLRRQIGVTCKLYRRVGDEVHLIPLNENVPPQTFPVGQVLWALRVLARVRA